MTAVSEIWTTDLPTFWLIPALVLSSISLVYTAVRVFARSQNIGRRLLVCTVNVVAYACILLLLINPQVTQSGAKTVTLITDTPDDIDEHGIKGFPRLYALPSVAADIAGVNAIPDVSVLPLRETGMGVLKLMGHGLSTRDWRAIPAAVDIEWTPANISGIVDVKWRKSVTIGEPWTVSGRFIAPQHYPENEVYTATLSDQAAQEIQSVPLRSNNHFSFTIRTPIDGPITYYLTVLDREKNELTRERVAISVTKTNPVKIMIIQSAPSFEVRQLMNWATSHGTELIIRTKISKDQYITQVANRPSLNDSSELRFERQDFLLMDGRAYMSSSQQERSNLTQAIRHGLGMLLMIDGELVASMPDARGHLLAQFELQQEESPNDKSTPIIAAFENNYSLPALPISISGPGTYPLVTSTEGTHLTVARREGNGVIALTRLRQSNALLTNGDAPAYSHYWAQVMGGIARNEAIPRLVPQGTREIPRVLDRLNICALLKSEAAIVHIAAPNDEAARTSLTLTSDQLGSNRHCALYEPTDTGWHQIQLSGDGNGSSDNGIWDIDYFYVYSDSDWQAVDQSNRQQASLFRLSAPRNPSEKASHRSNLFAPKWLWVMFVLSAFFLWLERKFN
ncbi:hypothetical protein [Kordiimonas aestuarii]|uniref:hypothetical protein n=1 Tax=Kordiimonas aestuarii TaxID=1005925 RepID=UPI0021D2A1D5|nr:hypothetical protein [Kordiimonas aestuarii]